MPSINISGIAQPPGGRGPFGVPSNTTGSRMTGPSSAVPWMRPGYDQAWASNRREQHATDDYDSALSQQASQMRASAQSQRQRNGQESQLFQQRQRQEQAELSERRRTLQAEIRQREQALAHGARADRSFSRLSYQASDTLSPQKFRNLMRQISIYKREYPTHNAELLTALSTGAGTEQHAMRTANVSRLGAIGNRAASLREWRRLAEVERDLARIESRAAKELRTATGAKRAGAQRTIGAVAQARRQIGAGREGMSPMTAMLGGAMGEAALAATGPIGIAAEMATAVAAAVATSPQMIAGAFRAALSMSQREITLQQRTRGMGRAGGWSGRYFENLIAPNGPRPLWQRAWGLDYQSTLANVGATGISPTSPYQAQQMAIGVRRAYWSPYNALSEQQLAQGAGTMTTLGVIRQGRNFESDFNRYFRVLGQVQQRSTELGLDHSQVAGTLTAMVRANSGGLNASSFDQMAAMWARLAGSGTPGARTGQDQISIIQGINNSVQTWGKNPAQNYIISSFFQHRGGAPKTADQLRKELGISAADWNQNYVNSAASKRALADFLQAANMGDAVGAFQYLGQLLQGHPTAINSIFNGSGITHGMNQQQADRARATFLQLSLGKSLVYSSGQGTLPASGGMPSDAIMKAAQAASEATGVPVRELLAVAGAESGFNPSAVSRTGALGAWQMLPSTARGLGYSRSDLSDPNKQAMAAAAYLKHLDAQFSDVKDPEQRFADVMAAYHDGPGRAAAIRRGNVSPEGQQDVARALAYRDVTFGNMPEGAAKNLPADALQAELTASRQAFNAVDKVLTSDVSANLIKFSTNVGDATTALGAFIGQLVNATHAAAQFQHAGPRGRGGYVAPNGMWVPDSAVPRVVK